MVGRMARMSWSFHKKTALILFVFAVAVSGAQLLTRAAKGLFPFRPLDTVSLTAAIVSFASLFIENKWTKGFQITILVGTGLAILSAGNIYFAACVLCIAFVLSYTYGFFNTYRWTKFSILAPLGYGAFILCAKVDGSFRFLDAFFFVFIVYAFILIVYFIFLDMFRKCRAYEEHLKESVEEEKARAIAEAVSEYRKNLSLLVEASERLLLIVDKRRERNHE